MVNAAEAERRPRTRNDLGRRSLWNTSHPEREDGRYYHRFVRYGRVVLNVHERVPDDRVEALAAQLVAASFAPEARKLTAKDVRFLLVDAEVAVFHYAADTLSVGESDISPALLKAAEKIADGLDAYSRLEEEEAATLRRFVRASHPRLATALHASDDLDPYTLRSALPQPRRGRTKTGDAAFNWMLESFLDDWVRRTGRPVTHARSPGSAHHFYLTAIDLMRLHPPVASADERGPVRAAAARLLPQIRHQLAAPWDNAVRGAAGG